MKILVTGAAGQLGRELRNVLEKEHAGMTDYIDKDELDLTDSIAVYKYVQAGGYSHIINCAAYTAVDRAEDEKSQCTAVNVNAVRNLAAAAGDIGAHMVHISTDYVFDGTGHRPYSESDKPAPMSHYGATKRRSETDLVGLLPDAIIVRTSWMYSPYGHNFVKVIMDKARKGDMLRVVDDQIGTPTYAADLARMIVIMVMAKQWIPGTYHFTNEGVASWYDFAKAIIELDGMADKTAVKPIPSADYPTAAHRPLYSVLSKAKIKATYGVTIPHWRESLSKCLRRINDQL